MKFIRVNMGTKAVSTEDVPEQYKGLGGRGLTSVMINEHLICFHGNSSFQC